MKTLLVTLLLASCPFLISGAAFAKEEQTAQAPVVNASSETENLATEADLLRRQLAAQIAINDQLRNRMAILEEQLADLRNNNSADGGRTASNTVVSLDPEAQPPSRETAEIIANSAIEQALVSKGLVILPFGLFRLTPNFTWTHDGSGDTESDSYQTSANLETGLPWGMSAAVHLPYIWRDSSALGTNNGLGDISFTLAKKLNNETETLPSFVTRINYTHDSGDDPYTTPGIGSGFRSLGLSLSMVKRVEPLVLYGDASFSHEIPDSMTLRDNDGNISFSGRIEPGDTFRLGLGVSLAATPDISLDAAVSYSFVEKTLYHPDNFDSFDIPRETIGYINLGADYLLTRNLMLSLSVAAGITDDAPDAVFSVSFPYLF